ncbi:MAG: hypothetical protein HOD72_05770 [Opitutae bacterium]|nr:hypothetical protein [Opitutae bacterium]MBT4223958.1 hypothetical protein [Opitutae bacterium]MBT5379350.1 hypothetical protein [Opitutae bacterium]MBT5690742.1 hypothetical protein [Opitutae bacterium]MBT6462333.1 hypothetical protein [Opitutae bacterium]
MSTYGESGGYHGKVRAGLGFATINSDTYLSMSFSPEFQLGKLNAAFDLEFYFGGDGSIRFRDDMYDDGAGWLRSIRHIYWGSSDDVFQTGVGTLYDMSFGTGMLVSHYNNASNWDQRKFGFLIDFNFPAFSIESFSSNLLNQELLAGRIAATPFFRYNAPFFNTLEVGATMLRDTEPDPIGIGVSSSSTLSAMGFDIGLYPIKTNGFQWKIFAEYANYENFGHGQGAGTMFRLPNLWDDVLDLEITYELRKAQEKFIPGYVNPAYELNRVRTGLLDLMDQAPNGISHYTQLHSRILESLHIEASYSSPVKESEMGLFTAEANIPDFFGPVSLSASYTKAHLNGLGGITDIDENSVARAMVDWRMTSMLYLSLLYRAHWIEETTINAMGDSIKIYKKQDTLQPQLAMKWKF